MSVHSQFLEVLIRFNAIWSEHRINVESRHMSFIKQELPKLWVHGLHFLSQVKGVILVAVKVDLVHAKVGQNRHIGGVYRSLQPAAGTINISRSFHIVLVHFVELKYRAQTLGALGCAGQRQIHRLGQSRSTQGYISKDGLPG